MKVAETEKIIIFSQSVSGHYLEYLHHLYLGALTRPEVQCIFVVPANFEHQRKLLEWPAADNVIWELVPDEKLPWGSWFARSYRYSCVIRGYLKKHRPDSLFLLDLKLTMPFLPLLTTGRVKISGILYGIYLYQWPTLSLSRKAAEATMHWLYAKFPRFERIYMLNDRSAAAYCNRLYHSDHFCFLPDPYMPCQSGECDFRRKYRINANKKVFLHFGSFGIKKGTLLILETIIAMPSEELEHCVFVFAGQVQNVIKERFFQLLEQAQKRVDIFVFNEFCSYDMLANWCRACDAILIPYLLTYNSSGCIGYAAQFHKPVIATNSGLLGKLVRRYRLGIPLSAVTTTNLRQALRHVDGWRSGTTAYLEDNNVTRFAAAIYRQEE